MENNANLALLFGLLVGILLLGTGALLPTLISIFIFVLILGFLGLLVLS